VAQLFGELEAEPSAQLDQHAALVVQVARDTDYHL
jgi:hypothetical protein